MLRAQRASTLPVTGSERSESPAKRSQTELPLGFDDGYKKLIAVCFAKRKPMNAGDFQNGYAVWIGMSEKDQIEAIRYYGKLAAEASSERYLPMPKNYLNSMAWTRKVAEFEDPQDLFMDEQTKLNEAKIAAWKRERSTGVIEMLPIKVGSPLRRSEKGVRHIRNIDRLAATIDGTKEPIYVPGSRKRSDAENQRIVEELAKQLGVK